MKHISCVEIQIKHFPLWSDIKKKQQQFNSKMWHCCFPYLFIKKNFWTEFMILDGSNNKNYFFLFVFVSVSFWLHVYVCMYLCTSLWLRSYKNIVTNCWCYRVPAWISNSKLRETSATDVMLHWIFLVFIFVAAWKSVGNRAEHVVYFIYFIAFQNTRCRIVYLSFNFFFLFKMKTKQK